MEMCHKYAQEIEKLKNRIQEEEKLRKDVEKELYEYKIFTLGKLREIFNEY